MSFNFNIFKTGHTSIESCFIINFFLFSPSYSLAIEAKKNNTKVINEEEHL